jgi:hypothetical protein
MPELYYKDIYSDRKKSQGKIYDLIMDNAHKIPY